MSPAPMAFADESFHEDDDGGFYVLAAAVLPADRHAELREAMLSLRGPRTGKLHWSALTGAQRLGVAKVVADFAELHLVAVGAPVPLRRQERARALCLQRLVTELHPRVEHLVAESRTAQLNARDVRTVQQIRRFALPKGTPFRIDHVPGACEPLLWISDVVAGAVRAKQRGDDEVFAPLVGCVVELRVDTRS